MIGLAGGLTLAGWHAGEATAGAAAYLVGSGSAVALTVATLIFFGSSELYHRAWADRARPDARLSRWGDLVSAIGAVALALSLALLGLPLLAATGGVLHALGKLGSAVRRTGTTGVPGWPPTWPDPYRSMVLLSRVPATLVAALAFGADLLTGTGPDGTMGTLLGPGVLLACNLLWARADLLLFRPAH